MVEEIRPKPRSPYRLVSDDQANHIRRLYRTYSLVELSKWLPLSYPTIRAIVRRKGAYELDCPEIVNCLDVQVALENNFEALTV